MGQKYKQINADREFVRALRDVQKKVEDRYNLRLSDSKATKIITPFLDRIFDPSDEMEDLNKKKSKNLFKIF